MNKLKSGLAAIGTPVRLLFLSDGREGLVLIAAAAIAMAFANSAWSHGYAELFEQPLAWTPIRKLANLHLWINDAVMVVFFFVVGLEVKRELVAGDLADPQARRLPLIAAFCGMAVPAAIFLALIGGDARLAQGWAIPSATDIAFAMGVVGMLGSRVPPSLRLFLLTVAIVDDIGAVLVIALFYTAQIKAVWLIAAAASFAALALINLKKVDRVWLYAAGAAVLWFCVLHSGIHATIAGVVAALFVPMSSRDGEPLLAPLEHALTPWNAYLVVPLFALANAGVDLRGLTPMALFAPLPLAIAAGLVIGKQAGILGAIAGARWLGIAPPPRDASWLQLWGVAVLCGIGFTMSLFIGTLAFAAEPVLFEQVKLGVLGGTLISVIVGYVILRLAPSQKRDRPA